MKAQRLRRQLCAATAAIALCVGLVSCASDGPTTDQVSQNEPSAPTDDGALTTPATPASEQAAPLSGRTRVAVDTYLPLLDATWEVALLDPAVPGAWLTAVTHDGTDFVVVALAWDQVGETQSVHQWRSGDGVSWDHDQDTLGKAWLNQVIGLDGRLLGLGSEADATGRDTPLVWLDDGTGWKQSDLGRDDDTTSLHLTGAAETSAGIVIGGTRETFHPIPPTVVTTGGFRIEVNDAAGTFTVTEVSTGRVIDTGPSADFYGWSAIGQSIYDPTTGDRLTEVPWDVWDDLYPATSPLPIPVFSGGDAEPAVIEWDGYRIAIDESTARFQLTDLDSGETLSGALEDLYRGPGPRIIDRDKGEVALELSWEEWDGLLLEVWEATDDPHVEHEAAAVVLFSEDGSIWETLRVSDAANSHLESVTAVGDGFVATVYEHLAYDQNRTAYVSSDGRTWQPAATEGPGYLSQTAGDGHELIAMASDDGPPYVTRSDDGLRWQRDLSVREQQGDRERAWLELVGSGPLGHVATGTAFAESGSYQLVITVGDRIATFGDVWAVDITDPDGGHILQLGWEELERAGEPGMPRHATYEDGATRFFDAEGALVMTISDDLVSAAYQEQASALDSSTRDLLFVRPTDDAWYEVDTPPRSGSMWTQQLAVGTDRVLIGQMVSDPSSSYTEGDGEGFDQGRIRVLVATFAQ